MCKQSASHPSRTDRAKNGAPTGLVMRARSKAWATRHSAGVESHPSQNEGWATLYNRVGVVKRHLVREGFVFPFVESFCLLAVALCFAHRPRPAFRILRWKLGSTSHLSGPCTSDHDSLFRLPALPGGKAPNQPNGDLLLHQGGPRAALHANQLRIIGLAAQHPVHPYRQLPGDGDFGHAAAPAQLQSLIVLS